MKIIIDTDIASAFAKTERLKLLHKLFSHWDVVITPEIYQELLVPLNYGYTFPQDIFDSVKTIYPTKEELNNFQKALSQYPKLGRGELEAIIVCISRGYAFSAIDRRAIETAESKSVIVYPLDVVLRLLWINNMLSKSEVEMFIQDLEDKDNLVIKDRDMIFEQQRR